LRRRINFKFWWIQFSGPAFRPSRDFCRVRLSMLLPQSSGSVSDEYGGLNGSTQH
jgi:hypothetical protein